MSTSKKAEIHLAYIRYERSNNTIFGRFYQGNHFLCYGIENVKYLIPQRCYEVVEYPSPKHGKVLLFKDVFERKYIEIHPANWARQLRGCIAAGDQIIDDMCPNSKKSLELLFSVLEQYNKWYIIIKNEIPLTTFTNYNQTL